MQCIQKNSSEVWGNMTVTLPPDLNYSGEPPHQGSYTETAHVINNIITPIVFILGIVGNSISLAVFGRKRPDGGGDAVEQSATTGLITLAISDLMFCLVGFPAIFLSKYSSGLGEGTMVIIGFYYAVYRTALHNIFLFISTWLVVLISAERFIAVCYALKARSLIRVYRTVIAHCLIFVLSLIINLPLFFKWQVGQLPCYPSCLCYARMPYWLIEHKAFEHAHLVVWFTIGTFLPLFLLLFFNICLLRGIYRSRSHVAGASDNKAEQRALSRVTWTLLTIVLCFFLLVFPSMLLQFLTWDPLGMPHNAHYKSLAIVITNLLQAIKFSINFLLYCAIHQRFREALGLRPSCPRIRTCPKAAGGSGTPAEKQQLQTRVSNGDKVQDFKDVAHV